MPTPEEFKELFLNTDIYLVLIGGEEKQVTVEEQGGSVIIRWASVEGTMKGVKFYKKGDKQTYMFVPVSGTAYEGSIGSVYTRGYLWTSSPDSSTAWSARHFSFELESSSGGGGIGVGGRKDGEPIRGVLAQ